MKVDVLIPQSSGRVRSSTHAGLSEASLKRAPLGTPAVAATGASFSHIKVVPQHSLKEPANDEASPPAMFQKQSYSQETEQIIAAPPPYQMSNLTASLANNASGTTFAAKARAAELNAVRSQKAAKGMETENEVHSAGSVALGAIKFTKPRNRGKVWKPLGLNELIEESVHGDETSSESTISTALSNSQLVQDPEPNNNGVAKGKLVQKESTETQASHRSGSTAVASSQQLHNATQAHKLEIRAGANDSTTGREKALLPMSDNEQPPRAEIHNGNPQLTTQGSSTLIQGYRLALMAEGDVRSKAEAGVAPSDYSLLNESKGKIQQTLTDTQETKLIKLGVLPALRSAESNGRRNHDDPFIEQPPILRSGSYNPSGQDKQLYRSNNDLILPASAGGFISNEFRPPVFPQFSPGQSLLLPLSKARTDREDSAHISIQHSQQLRDTKPYTSFAADKKELLLKNLNDVVASSMIQGSLPIATRTVLYDPAAREAEKQAPDSSVGGVFQETQGEGGNPLVSAAGKESLKTSDPLPWTDRPVKIHDTVPPLTPVAHLSLLQKSLTTQMPLTSPVDGTFEDAHQPFLNGLGLNHPQGVHINVDQDSVENAEVMKDRGMTCEGVNDSQCGKGELPACNGSPGSLAATQPISWLMEAAYHNLIRYLDKSDRDYFKRYAQVPEWCIDKSPGGDQSFFGDWGAWGPPPPRVGRDPRYRPTFHEGRYTVFEEIGRRGGRDGLIRRYH